MVEFETPGGAAPIAMCMTGMPAVWAADAADAIADRGEAGND